MDEKDKNILRELMRKSMVEYYKHEEAFVKQTIGLLDHIKEKQNLLKIGKIIDNKLNKIKN